MLLERLGTGGMSEVDLARRSMSDAGYVRLVVIKRIKADRAADASFVRMFKDEARITAELDHPNIGRVYDFGREGDEYFLVLEYVPGVDLRQLITELAERRQRVPLRIALGILVRVLDALDHAHRKRDQAGKPMNVVHRDVNPRNVMLSVRGDVKLIDFGVAFAADRLERTRTDHVKGKFSYMAPEQISGDKVDLRADLYAVGLTLHELLTGAGPYAGLNQIQILHRMMSGEVPKPPAVPELLDPAPLQAVHRKALLKDRAARYQSAAELRDALLDVLAPLGGLPSSEDLALFLRRTSPDTVDRIEAKIETYSAGGAPVPGTAPEEPSGTTFPGFPESTIDRAPEPRPVVRPRDDSASMSRVRPMGVVAGGVLVGVALGAAILVLGLGVVGLIGWGVVHSTATEEAPLVTAPVEPIVSTAPTPPEEVVAEPAAAVTPVSPGVRPTAPRPAPEPVPETVVAAPEPAPEPVPAPQEAPVAPSELGTVQVTASEKGRAITVDGAPTGRVTPAQLSLAVGLHLVAVEGFTAQQVTVRRNQVQPLVFRP
jgi:serine/threonine-protein kinase